MNSSNPIRVLRALVAWALVLGWSGAYPVYGSDAIKVLHVDSYHRGFTWSTCIREGIRSRLLVENVWFKSIYLDAWRNPSPHRVAQEADMVREKIRELDPDVVITSDDAAAKLVSENASEFTSTRFVYSGVNWNADQYHFPSDRVTGIVESPLIRSLVDLLGEYAEGDRIGYLSLDTLSGWRDMKHYPLQLGRKLDQAYLVRDIEEWKQRFIELQSEVDLLILDTPEDAAGWEPNELHEFVRRESRIPVGSTYESLAPVSLICIARIPQEQGWWAADAALKIMQGAPPASIPVARNREGKLIVNLDLAHRLNLTISQEILEIADILK